MSLNLFVKFGIVSTPVKLDAGPRKAENMSFRQMAPNGEPCRQKMVDSNGQTVEKSDIRKGLEVAPDTYVIVPDDEVKAMAPAKDPSINLKEFVAADKLDPLCFCEAHYLKPADAGISAYNLIYSALKETGKIGLGRAVLYGSDHAIALRAGKYGLVLHTLYFEDELRSMREFRPDLSTVDAAQRDMAVKLIAAMSSEEFDAGKYPNTYAAKYRALVEQKSATVSGVLQMPTPAAPRPDIMAQMEATLEMLRKPATVQEMPAPPRRTRRAAREAVSA